jgi:hypothetical protein
VVLGRVVRHAAAGLVGEFRLGAATSPLDAGFPKDGQCGWMDRIAGIGEADGTRDAMGGTLPMDVLDFLVQSVE